MHVRTSARLILSISNVPKTATGDAPMNRTWFLVPGRLADSMGPQCREPESECVNDQRSGYRVAPLSSRPISGRKCNWAHCLLRTFVKLVMLMASSLFFIY